jgi:hypothetical protein
VMYLKDMTTEDGYPEPHTVTNMRIKTELLRHARGKYREEYHNNPHLKKYMDKTGVTGETLHSIVRNIRAGARNDEHIQDRRYKLVPRNVNEYIRSGQFFNDMPKLISPMRLASLDWYTDKLPTNAEDSPQALARVMNFDYAIYPEESKRLERICRAYVNARWEGRVQR